MKSGKWKWKHKCRNSHQETIVLTNNMLDLLFDKMHLCKLNCIKFLIFPPNYILDKYNNLEHFLPVKKWNWMLCTTLWSLKTKLLYKNDFYYHVPQIYLHNYYFEEENTPILCTMMYYVAFDKILLWKLNCMKFPITH